MKLKTIAMRKIYYVLSASIFLTFNSYSQVPDTIAIPVNAKGFAEYTEVVALDSVSKDVLYLNALNWVNKTYKSGRSVIQSTDKDGGMIIGNANSDGLVYNNIGVKSDAGYFSYTISIFCKDNRYKYVIDNITYNKGEMMLKSGADLGEAFPSNWTGLIGNNKQTRREWKKFQFQANNEFKLIIADLKATMSSASKLNDW